MKCILWSVYARRVCRPDAHFLASIDLKQPLQGWTPGQPTQGRPCWTNPGLSDSNPFGVAESTALFGQVATLKGWPALSPGLERSDYPGSTAIGANPVRVESIPGGTP